jgi:hypothetical protein
MISIHTVVLPDAVPPVTPMIKAGRQGRSSREREGRVRGGRGRGTLER